MSSTCRELRMISSYLFPFILSLSFHLISATLPSVLPIVPFRTAPHPLFHSYRSSITPPFYALPYTAFPIVSPFLRCLVTASFIVLHCFALLPCSIPSYTASVIVLHSTSISVHLLFSMVYKPRYLGLYPHSDLFVNPLPCSSSDLIALPTLSLRSPLPPPSASVICP
jgi:hypothetical protein